jgi:hypothetical protein
MNIVARPTHGHGLMVHNLGRAQNCLDWGPLRNGADEPINLYFNHWITLFNSHHSDAEFLYESAVNLSLSYKTQIMTLIAIVVTWLNITAHGM